MTVGLVHPAGRMHKISFIGKAFTCGDEVGLGVNFYPAFQSLK
jgi:hypothetical protein